ncbi:NAD(P)-binding domain-containing protein [Lyngbya aestuarii]|uniref:NAD(P)-binding domain-containing protein n=1 Tax=Lyngbya aestuarii TaxID=118322 RepID=UPI00403D8A03
MKVGFLGTGLMGEPMAERLLQAGLSVVAYNRTKLKLESLKKSGAEIVETPQEAITSSDCVILMLTNATAIQDVLLSKASRQHLSGCTVIQMSTIAPSESREIQKAVNGAGGDYLEAPVLGSIPQVKSGELQVMVGATPELFNKWFDLLKNFGTEPMLIGEVGSASALKLALNQLIASLTSAFALSLGFIQRQGVDVEKFMGILRESALYAPTFDKKLKRMVDYNFDNPNFPSKHLLKDTDLFLKEAQLVEQNVSSLEGVRKVIDMALQLGLADQDYSALFAAINPQQD